MALHARIETLSVFLSGECFLGQNVDLKDVRKLFSRLYEAGIVIEKWLDPYGDGAVSSYFLTSNLPILTMFMLSVPLLSVGSFALQSPYPLCITIICMDDFTAQSIVQWNIQLYLKSLALRSKSQRHSMQELKGTRFHQNSEIQCENLYKKASSLAGNAT